MSILTDAEVNNAWESACTADPTCGQQRFKLTRAIESAVLEKVAAWIEPQRNDIPANGFEFASAIRALKEPQ